MFKKYPLINVENFIFNLIMKLKKFAKRGYIVDFDDEFYKSLLKELDGHSLVDESRCSILYQSAKQTLSLNGDIAEIGVFKGGTAKLIAKTCKNKTVHLFDTFEGMPETDPNKDKHKQGDFDDTSIEFVKKYLKDCDNIEIYQGFFPETAGPITDKQFSLVHIDVDIYKSVVDCCDFFYQRMVNGGIMIFDDYGFSTCPGAKNAVDEFFKDKPETPLFLKTGQCLVHNLPN